MSENRGKIAIVALFGIGALLVARGAGASFADIVTGDDASNDYVPDEAPSTPVDSGGNMGDTADQNTIAFLALIRAVEPNPSDPYHSLVGGGSFSDMSDHPANLGWPGKTIQSGPYAGLKTTAAGAYQITRTTWNWMDGKNRFGSFDPAAQDAAAIYILQVKRPESWPLVQNGDFYGAISALAQEWEAFGKILAGSYRVSADQAAQIYADAGGSFA